MWPFSRSPDIDAKLADLRARRDAMGDPNDVAQTYNAQAAFARDHSELSGRIATIVQSSRVLEEVEPLIARLVEWDDTLERIRQLLAAEMLALPSPTHTAQERGALWNLTLSIQTIDRGLRILDGTGLMLEQTRLGELMRQHGFVQDQPPPPDETGLRLPWLGAQPEVRRRLAELQARCNDAQTRLDAALREPTPV